MLKIQEGAREPAAEQGLSRTDIGWFRAFEVKSLGFRAYFLGV